MFIFEVFCCKLILYSQMERFSMKKFIILSFVFLLSIPVFAAEWVQVGDKEYVDKESIFQFNQYGNEHISFWIKSLNDKSKLFVDFEKAFKTKVWYVKSLWEINCTQKKIIIRDKVVYDLNQNVIYSFDDTFSKWNKIVPDTVGDYYYNTFCK